MKLDESRLSKITNESVVVEMLDVIYGGSDNRPVWIGGYRPTTNINILKPQADWASTHYDFYLNFVEKYMKPDRCVLDIGCGAGQYTAMLARYSNLAMGIDRDPKAIKFANRHNRATGASFMLGNFPCANIQKRFDYIFCIETMEHIPYEKQLDFIDASLDSLSEGGMMFITTPDEETAAPPHIGIWSSSWMPTIKQHLASRSNLLSHFDNTNPKEGFVDRKSSHYAMVLCP